MKKIKEAQEILKALGLEKQQQNEISALTLLALASISPRSKWNSAQKKSLTISKGIMVFVSEVYEKNYKPNSRESFRRQVLHQFTQAGVTDYNPDDPTLAVNSSKAHYALTDEAIDVIKAFGTSSFGPLSKKFIESLTERQAKHQTKRNIERIPLKLSDGREFLLSPGSHNEVGVAVVQEFASRFAKGANLLYLGDTENKEIIFEKEILKDLGCEIIDHGKLPDVILYLKEKRWLFLVECVTSHGPVSQKRVNELRGLFPEKNFGIIFVSAFPDATVFRKYVADIAWDTEVWLADAPDHLIHFNGDRFMGPRR
ncbi:MAG: restriction endonuclease [Bdellovibrionales bacterium RIFOXYD12_FULL_39_22]|nr:MAG: restriction endonuclease [Bdellovibrionales bacterium RIFOXYB1_FULL_39_21]OFZ42451.1 MAG: restriction endonuclease [Bdellovibrionales bacterium RIFOXYC12_FULL_39_17]OFZ45427.1 MAG: restriction endonuclease [Bdellovibrionales bacterium RIFOXYC1_FULL_39_130]OFZ73194.1 MAG: restriction endonuclease [Bdellovibrionales bacterium RIFOXYC2_FULL_39_8]OFZ74624.1 MAG: restriction endonuclease [Bdellovibrionales bacterium RIFOXYD1_FULL_39_84]OFZ92906.1 MAG: restriction endonuclease [Bdellovibrion